MRKEKNEKYVRQPCVHYNIFNRSRGRNIKKQPMLAPNEVKELRKIVVKTKLVRIRSQKTRESWGIYPINELVERRRE
jgi:hypothetical protein